MFIQYLMQCLAQASSSSLFLRVSESDLPLIHKVNTHTTNLKAFLQEITSLFFCLFVIGKKNKRKYSRCPAIRSWLNILWHINLCEIVHSKWNVTVHLCLLIWRAIHNILIESDTFKAIHTGWYHLNKSSAHRHIYIYT